MNAPAVNQRACFRIEMKEGETHSRTLIHTHTHACTHNGVERAKQTGAKKHTARKREPFGTALLSGESFKAP